MDEGIAMNFIQIALTTKCNLACPHCPIEAYRNTDDEPFTLSAARLIPWLAKYVDPKEWVVELTGGEPALFKDLDRLCQWLSGNKYQTIIKTNGILPIEPHPHILRVAAFHNLDRPPRYFDIILIIDKLDREAKEKYCKEHGWPYKVIGFNKESPDGATHGFDKIAFIDPHGHNVPCPSCPILWKSGDDPYTIEKKPLSKGRCCPQCKAAIDAWRFLYI